MCFMLYFPPLEDSLNFAELTTLAGIVKKATNLIQKSLIQETDILQNAFSSFSLTRLPHETRGIYLFFHSTDISHIHFL